MVDANGKETISDSIITTRTFSWVRRGGGSVQIVRHFSLDIRVIEFDWGRYTSQYPVFGKAIETAVVVGFRDVFSSALVSIKRIQRDVFTGRTIV